MNVSGPLLVLLVQNLKPAGPHTVGDNTALMTQSISVQAVFCVKVGQTSIFFPGSPAYVFVLGLCAIGGCGQGTVVYEYSGPLMTPVFHLLALHLCEAGCSCWLHPVSLQFTHTSRTPWVGAEWPGDLRSVWIILCWTSVHLVSESFLNGVYAILGLILLFTNIWPICFFCCNCQHLTYILFLST